MSKEGSREWVSKPLKDIVDRFIVPMRDKPKVFSGSTPWVRIEDFDGKWISRSKSAQTVDSETIAKMNLKVNPVDTVLCSCSATLGICAIVKKPLITNQTFIGLVPNGYVDKEFLYYKLTASAKKLQSLSTGTTISYLPREKFEEFVIDIPKQVTEQKQIAEILSSVDEVINLYELKLSKLNYLMKATSDKLLQYGIGDSILRKTNIGEIPKHWKVESLERCAKVIDSLHQTPTFSLAGYAMIRVTDIKTGDIYLGNAMKVGEDIYKNFTRNHRPKKGDIVMSRVGSYGISSYINTDQPLCIGQNTVVITPNKVDSLYLYYVLNSSSIKRQIEFEVAGTGYKSLSLASIKALLMPLPDINEQAKIASTLRSIDDSISDLKTQKEKLTYLRSALMQDLLTGKVRVPVN